MSQLSFTIDAAKMHEALAFCMNCVETKTTMPILSHILIKSEGDGIRVSATDLDVSVSMLLEAKVKEPGALAVIGKPLLAQFSGRSGDAVISTSANDRMLIKVGGSKANLVGLKADNFPKLPEYSGDPVLTFGAARFSRMIRNVLYATTPSKGGVITNWQFARVSSADGVMRMTGLDGQRMATCTAESTAEIKAISIPKVMASLASKYPWSMSEDVMVHSDDNSLHFVTPNLQITCRQLASNHFPDVVNFLLRIDGGNVCVVPRKDLVSAISSAAIFATRGQNMNPSMHLKFTESSVKLSAANDDCGNYESEIPCIGNCSIEIGVQPSYLSDFLSSTNEESVAFRFGEKLDKAAPFEMRPGDGSSETYRYVVKPLYI